MSESTSTTRASARRLWLESPLWDTVWMLNALWLAPLLLLAWGAGQASFVSAKLLTLGTLLLWGGHILSPIAAAWRSPILRATIQEQKGRWIVKPLVVVALCVLAATLGIGALFDSASDARFVELYSLLLVVFLIWNNWHFAAQHFGVLSIYRRLAGDQSAATRSLDRRYTMVLTFLLVPVAWYLQAERLGPLFRLLPAPRTGGAGTTVVISIAVLGALFMLVREWRAETPSWGRAGTILTIAIQPIVAAVSYPLFNFALYSMSHWIIALALSSRLLASYPDAEAAEPEASRGSFARFHVAFATLAALSVPLYLFFWSDRVAAGTNHLISGIFRRSSAIAEPSAAVPTGLAVVVGLYFGLTFVHFLYDRGLYGFSRPEVRRGVAPFLFAPLRSRSER